jgi:hypothetical protein
MSGSLRGSPDSVKQHLRQNRDEGNFLCERPDGENQPVDFFYAPSPQIPGFTGFLPTARAELAKKIKKTSQTLLRFFRDPHRSRPPTRQTVICTAKGD